MKAEKSTTKERGWSVDLQPGEVIPRGRPIVVHANAAIAKDGWSGLAIAGQRVAVKPGKDDRAAEVDTSTLPPGRHTLRIDELILKRSSEKLANDAIPFLVVDTAAPLTAKSVVRHGVRLRIGELSVERTPMQGKCGKDMVEVFKVEDRKSGKWGQLAFDASGKPVDLDKALLEMEKRRLRKYGKLHPDLFDLIERQPEAAKVPVAVWLVGDVAGLPKKSTKSPQRKPSREQLKRRELIKQLTGRFATYAKEQGFEVQRTDTAAPVVFLTVPAKRVAELAKSEQVAGLFLHDPEGVDDLGDAMDIADANDAHAAGFTGRGVNVAVYESGPDVTTNLNIVDRFDSSPTTSDHSRLTHAVIQNTQRSAPHGFAPDCNLHSANDKDLDALTWAVEDRGCTVISQSFHRSAEQTSSGLSFDDIYKDYLALNWPYPTICEAAGNIVTSDGDTVDEFVNHKGFNRLAVGNHNDSATAMSSSTTFRNPASSHGDRELPEIAANGTSVSAVNLTKSGTSFAAPAVAGSVAVIQQAAPILTSWPEGCRAIMLASAWRNPGGNSWHDDLVSGVDASDGSGALDTFSAMQIARAWRSPNNRPASRGFGIGNLDSADLDGDGFLNSVYRISVPRTLLAPTVKVALAWDSEVVRFNILGFELFFGSFLTVDLDLIVRDSSGATVATSISWDNSYEIVEFAARRGETYEIRIHRYSGESDVWFGVAWQVRGINFFTDHFADLNELLVGER